MADLKISQLSGATTPLAGTEVLPIVQSNTTKKVSVADLTEGRSISATDATLTTGNIVFDASGKGVKGTTTNDAAEVGVVGEYISSTVIGGSGPSFPSGGFVNITTITLTAGDWDVSGMVGYYDAAGTAMFLYSQACISTTSGAFTNDVVSFSWNGVLASYYVNLQVVVPSVRLSLASTTTVYLVGRVGLSAGALTGFGKINARRVR